MHHSVSHLRPVADGEHGGDLVGTSAGMVRLREQIGAMARVDAPVLITGESGTGKALVARALHAASGRSDHVFCTLDCAAFGEERVESELFGDARRVGRLELARGGTLLFDHVADLPPRTQAKLLHVLETGTYEPPGSMEPVLVDVRVISAACGLGDAVAAGRFRQDLYWRLKVLVVVVPPLRERLEDLPALVESVVARFGDGRALQPTAGFVRALERHPFPGNVRELENVVRHAVALARGDALDVEHLPTELAVRPVPTVADRPVRIRPLVESVRAYERTQILEALRFTRGLRMEAAQNLRISRKCLWEKMKAYAIQDEEFAD